MRPECRGAEGVQLHAFACRGCYSNGNVNTPLRRRPHHHAAVPRRQRRRVRPFDRQSQPAVRGTHQGDVADGQVAAGDELAALQRLVQNLRAGVAALDRQVDGGVIALGFGGADQAQEGWDHDALPFGGLPVHPAVGVGAQADVLGPEGAGAVARGQVAHDGIRFPQHEAAVVDGGHGAVGVDLGVLGRVDHAERAAGLDEGVRQRQFAHGQHHLLHIDGRQPSPDLQHNRSL